MACLYLRVGRLKRAAGEADREHQLDGGEAELERPLGQRVRKQRAPGDAGQ
jgi:hypothetical protein